MSNRPRLRVVKGPARNTAADAARDSAPRSVRRVVAPKSRHVTAPDEPQLTQDAIANLVGRAKDGDRKSFDQLVRVTHRDAYGLALRLLSNSEDARDVVQEAYLRAYRGIGKFRGEARFSTWLYRIVANCAATALARRQRVRHEELTLEDDVVDPRPDNDPARQMETTDLRERLDAAIADLPPRLRAVVVLRDVYDMPHSAISTELGISVTAAKVRLHRARLRLRQQVLPLTKKEGDGAV